MSTNLIAGDAVNGFTVSADTSGSLSIQTGPSGGKVAAVNIDATGQAVFAKIPQNSVAQSMVRLSGSNGYGSTNTKIRRYSTVVTNQGSDITYADSATLGASFTINTSGVYAISLTDNFVGAAGIGASVNTTQPTVAVYSLSNASEILTASTTSIANQVAAASWIGYLSAGSIVRPHGDSAGAGASTTAFNCTIVRVA